MLNQYQEKVLLCATCCAVSDCAKETAWKIMLILESKYLYRLALADFQFIEFAILKHYTLNAQTSLQKKSLKGLLTTASINGGIFRYRRNFINRRWISMLTWTVYFSTSSIDSTPGYYVLFFLKKGEKLTRKKKRVPTSSRTRLTVKDVSSPAQRLNRLC